MKELVIISGKGGTGKTSITASFAALAKNKVIADCDVDAADMHLILAPKIVTSEKFQGGKEAVLNKDKCVLCGNCENICRFDAVKNTGWQYEINPFLCEGCGICSHNCPTYAIEMQQKTAGSYFISETRNGPFVHGELNAAEDNSGKLVSKIREEAQAIAKEQSLDLIIIDGAPGTGCPVIASITGAHCALIVTEPTISGFHDMKRIIELTEHFKIKTIVCINKCDINPDLTKEMNNFCCDRNIAVKAEIPYDTEITRAQIDGKSIVEYSNDPTALSVRELWKSIEQEIL